MADVSDERVDEAMEADENVALRKEASVDSDELDDNDESSDETSDDDNALEGEAAEFEKKVSENPYDYDSYVELISRLKKMGELDRLRQAREKMSGNFPLTPELWLSWLQDEIKLATSDSERKVIYELFERAVEDYLSVDVWLEYAQFSIGDMAVEGGIEKVCSIFERALTAVGLHVARGTIIWEAYREFANILCAQKLGTNEKEDAEGQYSRVVKLFKRQLAVPLLDMENTYAEFQNWLTNLGETIDTKNIEHGYKRALSKLSKILPHEEKLLSCPVEGRSECYRQYIEHESNTDSAPTRVQCLYERAIAEDKTPDATLWLEYIGYLHNILRVETVVLAACRRAVRNCPWNSSLWQHYLRILERLSKPHEEIKAVMEAALSAGFATSNDYLELWLSYLDYLRRKIDFSLAEHAGMIEELVASFNKACEHLAQAFGLDGDPNCTILQYWARCEAIHRKNMTQCRLLWNDILSQGHKKTAAMWLEYSSLERTYGTDKKHLRRLYARALNAVEDWPESIGTAWLNFERDEGTLTQFETCLDKFRARMKVVTAQREASRPQHEQRRRGDRYLQEGRGGKPPPKQKPPQTKRKHDAQDGKWSGVAAQTYTERPAARSSRSGEETTDQAFRMPPPAEKGPPPPGYKPPTEKGPPPPGYKPPTEKGPPPPGYKPDSGEDEAPRKRMKTDETQPKEAVPTGPIVHNPAKDDRTVFLSNLDYSATEDVIRELFIGVGTLTDIRLVKNFQGRSKGYGYIEFSSASEAAAALTKDREKVDGRPMFVSKCDPDKHTRQKIFRYSGNLEKNKLFIRDLPHSTTKEDLMEIYKCFGTLKEVRIVTYRNGHSKGLAYVEFEDAASAGSALLKTDGMEIKDKTIQVAISKPPERRDQAASLIPSLGGGGEREIGARGRVKMACSLLPRSVQLAQSTAAPASSTTTNGDSTNGDKGSEDTKKAMSNQDFRQMLLGSKK